MRTCSLLVFCCLYFKVLKKLRLSYCILMINYLMLKEAKNNQQINIE